MWCMWWLGASFSSCQRVVCPHACKPGLRLLERLRSSTYTPSNAPPSPPPFLITPPLHPATTVVDAQNALTSSVLEQCGSRDQFRDLFTHLYNYERYGTPYKKGSRWVGGWVGVVAGVPGCKSAGLQEGEGLTVIALQAASQSRGLEQLWGVGGAHSWQHAGS